MIYSCVAELKQACANLTQSKGLLVSVMATLSLPLAAFIVCSVFLYQVYFKPLPYLEPERQIEFKAELVSADAVTRRGMSYGDALDLLENKTLFKQGFTTMSPGGALITSDMQGINVETAFVSPNYFSQMRVPMHLGRGFDQREAPGSQSQSIVISYDFWQSYFQGDPEIVGKTLEMEYSGREIVGVTGKGFEFPEFFGPGPRVQAYFPDINPPNQTLDSIMSDGRAYAALAPHFKFFAVLADDVTMEQALAEVSRLQRPKYIEARQTLADLDGIEKVFQANSLRDTLFAESQPTSYKMLAAATGMLLLALVNVFGLLLMQMVKQQRQFAISAALGAAPSQLFRAVWLEFSVLFGSILLVASCFALLIMATLKAHIFERLAGIGAVTISAEIWLFAVILCMGIALIFSLLTLTTLKYRHLFSQMQQSGKGTSVQIASWIRQALLIIQGALAIVIVAVSIQVTSKSIETIQQPLGYDVENTAFVFPEFDGFRDRDRDHKETRTRIMAFKQALSEVPEVVSVAAVRGGIDGNFIGAGINTEPSASGAIFTHYQSIDWDFFTTAEIELIAGRSYTQEEVFEGAKLLVINQELAEKLNLTNKDLGQSLYYANRQGEYSAYELIGISSNVLRPNASPIPRVYRPTDYSSNHFIVRYSEASRANQQQLTDAINGVEDTAYVSLYIEYKENHKERVLLDKIAAIMGAVFTLVTSALLVLGLFGLINYATVVTSYQYGVKLALGAQASTLQQQSAINHFWTGLAMSGGALLIIALLQLVLPADYIPSFLNQALVCLAAATTLMIIADISLRQLVKRWPIHSLQNQC